MPNKIHSDILPKLCLNCFKRKKKKSHPPWYWGLLDEKNRGEREEKEKKNIWEDPSTSG